MIPTLQQLRFVKHLLISIFLTCALLLGASVVYVLTHENGSASSGTYECALVFGAGIWGLDSPSPAIERRVGAAATLYSQGRIERVIFSGGKGDEHRATEASVMRKVAMRMGIDPGDIVLEEESTSTYENLVNSRDLIKDCNGIVGISDMYHLGRIEMLADIIGIGDFPTSPTGDRPPLLFDIKSTLREGVGVLYYLPALLIH